MLSHIERISLPIAIALPLFGCASDNEISVQRQELRTDENTYDIDIVAVGERKTIITLQSVGLEVSQYTASPLLIRSTLWCYLLGPKRIQMVMV